MKNHKGLLRKNSFDLKTSATNCFEPLSAFVGDAHPVVLPPTLYFWSRMVVYTPPLLLLLFTPTEVFRETILRLARTVGHSPLIAYPLVRKIRHISDDFFSVNQRVLCVSLSSSPSHPKEEVVN